MKRQAEDKDVASSYQPLLGKAIYLDAPGFRGSATLEENLRRLGATLEKCFSKEVHWLITNNKSHLDGLRNSTTSPSNLSPANLSPSPFNTGAVNSPQADSPSGTGRSGGNKPMTRGMAIAQKAMNTKNYGSTNLVETAKQLKIKIIPLDQAQRYVTKEIAKLPEQSDKDSKASDGKRKPKVRALKGDFVKFESVTQQYKPVTQEFTSFPKVNTETPTGSCPFENRKNSAPKQEVAEKEKKKSGKAVVCEAAEANDNQIPGPSQSKGKKKEVNTLYASSKYTSEQLRQIMIEKAEKAKAEAKKGYCELCSVKYDNLDQHVKQDTHKSFVRKESNFYSLDLIIARGPNMEQFLNDVVKYHHEHVKEGLQMSEMEDEVMLISQATSLDSEKNNSKVQETPKRAARKVQFKKLRAAKSAKLLQNDNDNKFEEELEENEEQLCSVSKEGSQRGGVSKQTVKPPPVKAKSPSPLKNTLPLELLAEDPVLRTPPKSPTKTYGKKRVPSARKTNITTPTPDKIAVKPCGSKVVSLQSLLKTPKKESPLVSTPKKESGATPKQKRTSTQKLDIVTDETRKKATFITTPKTVTPAAASPTKAPQESRLQAAKRLLTNILDEKTRGSSECSDIIPIVGKITPTCSTHTPVSVKNVSSANQDNNITRSQPINMASLKQLDGITKLPESKEVKETDSIRKVQSAEVCEPEKTEPTKDSNSGDPEQKDTKDKANIPAAVDPETRSLPSRETVEAATRAGLMVVACASISSQESFDPKSRPNPPLKTYSRKSHTDSPSVSKQESNAVTSKQESFTGKQESFTGKQESVTEKQESCTVDRVQVSLEHNYSSPIKQDPNERKRVAEENSMEIVSPKTPGQTPRRQKVKVKGQFSILSDRSMNKLLQSDGDHDFEGFNESNQNLLPTDVSYVDVSEISVSDNSDVEWNLDSYKKSPVKKPGKSKPRTPAKAKPPIDASLVLPDPQVDIVDESQNPSLSWENVKGARNILDTYFNPYLQGVQQEKLWMNSSPMKPNTPVKTQEETESLTSIAEDKLATPLAQKSVIGPMHSTPVPNKHTPRRSPRKRLHSRGEETPVNGEIKRNPRKRLLSGPMDKSIEEGDSGVKKLKSGDELDSSLKQSPRKRKHLDSEDKGLHEPVRKSPRKRLASVEEEKALDDSGVVSFKPGTVLSTPISCKSPPAPKRKLTPQSALHALTSHKKSVPKHLPAEIVLSANRSVSEVSDASSIVSSTSNKLLKQKSHRQKSYTFAYMNNSSKPHSQKDFDKMVQDYRNSRKDAGNSSLDQTLPLNDSSHKDKSDNGSASGKSKAATKDKEDKKQDAVDTKLTPGFIPNVRLSLTIMKSSKKGCLCHEHTADSPCPFANTPKKVEENANRETNNETTAEVRKLRKDKVRKRLDSGMDMKSEQKTEQISNAKTNDNGLKRSTREAQKKSPVKKTPKNNAKLETVGRNTRKSVKRKSASAISPKKNRGVSEYDFSSGLDH